MICYCTNIWNHHQGPVCQELARLYGNEFRMILHQPLDSPNSIERMQMGWSIRPPKESWIIEPPEHCASADYSEHRRMALASDVLVMDSVAPYLTHGMLVDRHKKGKINIQLGERFFKSGRPWYYALWPRKWVGRWVMRHRLESAHIHFFTMGHWCASDLKYLGACKGRTWRWGYLTNVSDRPTDKPMREKLRVGWCGRFLCCKNVCDILTATSLLEDEAKKRIEVVIVGDGPEKGNLTSLAHRLGLDGIVAFRPFLPQKDALAFMESVDIYPFPSNRFEGWGATLLEAMDKSCVVVANEAAGATLEVVQNGKNGFAYKDGDIARLAECMGWLIEHEKERREMGFRAWRTIQDWSPCVGALRLKNLVDRHMIPNASYVNGLCGLVR